MANKAHTSDNRKSATERGHVREFLAQEGIPFIPQSIRSVPNGCAGPDVKVTCLQNGTRCRIGIELVEYQVDAGETGGSSARRLKAVWSTIWKTLRTVHFKKSPILDTLKVSVTFKDIACPRKADLDALAKELAQFVLSIHPEITQRRQRWDTRHFQPSSLLETHVARLDIVPRNEGMYAKCTWRYNPGGFGGLVPERVSKLIESKACKNRKYDWARCGRKWLLIYASGKTYASRGGDRDSCEHRVLTPEIIDQTAQSGFDRVVFWERVGRWTVTIGPGRIAP